MAQDVTKLRDDFKTLENNTNQKVEQTMKVVVSETKKLQDQIDSLKKNQIETSNMDREVTIDHKPAAKSNTCLAVQGTSRDS